jgi:hypothetical protein
VELRSSALLGIYYSSIAKGKSNGAMRPPKGENRAMAPRKIKNLSLPECLRIETEKVAKAQERSVNDVLAEAVGYYVDRYVKDQQWASLKRYGSEKARECRIDEEDVDRLIAESRNSMSR